MSLLGINLSNGVCAIILCLLSSSASAQTTGLQLQGNSGKFTLYDVDLGLNETVNKVRVELDYLYELSADGEKLGAGGPPSERHSVETFANQEFVIEEDSSVTELDGVAADLIRFQSQIGAAGTLQLNTYVFQESGVVSIFDDENRTVDTWNVTEGDVKFNLILSDWTYCTAGVRCGATNAPSSGEIIEVGVQIQAFSGSEDDDDSSDDGEGDDDDDNESGDDDDDDDDDNSPGNSPGNNPGNNPNNRFLDEDDDDDDSDDYDDQPEEVDLGANIPLLLSSYVSIDGNWTTMNSTAVSKGSSTVYVFRFPKFDDEAIYDPILGYSGASDIPIDGDNGGNTSGAKLFGSSFLFLCAVVSAALFI